MSALLLAAIMHSGNTTPDGGGPPIDVAAYHKCWAESGPIDDPIRSDTIIDSECRERATKKSAPKLVKKRGGAR